MELPLNITRAGSARVALPGFTRNISSSGVLFTSGASPDLGGPIEYIITLNHESGQPVNLRCMGRSSAPNRFTVTIDGLTKWPPLSSATSSFVNA